MGSKYTFIDSIFSSKKNKFFAFSFNWINVLIIILFYNYSFYGIGTKLPGKYYSLFFEILLIAILSIFYFCPINITNKFKESYKISLIDLGALCFIFLILILIGHDYFSISLVGDSISHAYGSIYHSSYISYFLFEKFNFNPKIGNILFLINWVLFIFFYFLIKYLISQKTIIRYLVFLGLFILIRLFFYIIGGINNFHPPGRYLPLFLSTLIFGINSIAFRIPQLVVLVLIFYNIFNFCKSKFNVIISLLISICFITIPVNLYSSFVVEQSIYTTFIILYVIIEIQNNDNKIPFSRLFALSAIFVLIRQPIVGVFLFLAVIYFGRSLKKSISEYAIFLYPLLLIIPFYFSIFFIGNPALNVEEGEYLSIFEKIVLFGESGIYFISSINHIYIYVIFLPLFFLYFKSNKKIYLLFLIINVEFFSIRPVLWGIGRYQVEYIIPFLFFGIIYFVNRFKNYKNGIYSFIVLLIVANLILFDNMFLINNYIKSNNKDYFSNIKMPFKNFIVSDFPLPLNDALIYFKTKYPGRTIILDDNSSMYGQLPLILNSFNTYNVLESKRIGSNLLNTRVNFILTESPFRFVDKGWVVIKEISNQFNYQPLFILKKKSGYDK